MKLHPVIIGIAAALDIALALLLALTIGAHDCGRITNGGIVLAIFFIVSIGTLGFDLHRSGADRELRGGIFRAGPICTLLAHSHGDARVRSRDCRGNAVSGCPQTVPGPLRSRYVKPDRLVRKRDLRVR